MIRGVFCLEKKLVFAEDFVEQRGFGLANVDVWFIVLLVEEDDGGVEHNGDFVFKLNYCMDAAESDFVERRTGRHAVDDEIAVVIDLNVVVVDELFEEKADVEFVGRFGTIFVGLIEWVDNFFGDHNWNSSVFFC